MSGLTKLLLLAFLIAFCTWHLWAWALFGLALLANVISLARWAFRPVNS